MWNDNEYRDKEINTN